MSSIDEIMDSAEIKASERRKFTSYTKPKIAKKPPPYHCLRL